MLFELELLRTTEGQNITDSSTDDEPEKPIITDRRGSQGSKSILLTGQMRYVKDINAIMFLCSPL